LNFPYFQGYSALSAFIGKRQAICGANNLPQKRQKDHSAGQLIFQCPPASSIVKVRLHNFYAYINIGYFLIGMVIFSPASKPASPCGN
jgi:hypothetical protein